MPDKTIVTAKLSAMSEYYNELIPYLEKYRTGEIPLNDPRIFIVERLFQLIADSAIDINTHIMTRAKFEASDDYEGTFRIIAKHGIIPVPLAEQISGSVGLRNRMVHGYEHVQRKKMMDDIAGGIEQYVVYMKHINDFFERKVRNEA